MSIEKNDNIIPFPFRLSPFPFSLRAEEILEDVIRRTMIEDMRNAYERQGGNDVGNPTQDIVLVNQKSYKFKIHSFEVEVYEFLGHGTSRLQSLMMKYAALIPDKSDTAFIFSKTIHSDGSHAVKFVYEMPEQHFWEFFEDAYHIFGAR